MINLYKNTDIMSKGLDVAWLRNEIISNNIANVNTPGYKSRKVVFEDVLKENLNSKKLSTTRTNSKHIANKPQNSIAKYEPKIITNNSKSLRNDKNNVDIDKEMAELTKNNIRFNFIAEQLIRDFNKIKNTINDGGR